MNKFIKSIIVVGVLLLSGCYVYPHGFREGMEPRDNFYDSGYYNNGYYMNNRYGYRNSYSGYGRGMRKHHHHNGFGRHHQGGRQGSVYRRGRYWRYS